MLGKVLASAVLGLCLVGACSSETPQTDRPTLPTRPPTATTTSPTATGATPPSATGAGAAGLGGLAQPSFGDNPTGIMPIAAGASLGSSGTGVPKDDDCGSGDFIGGRVTPVVWL